MKIRPIKTEQDYLDTLSRIEEIFDCSPLDSESDELEILSILVEKYEEEHFKIELPDPIEAIKFRMEQLDLQQKDLVQIIGLKSRVSEILNKKRKLSLSSIRQLSQFLNISSTVLIQEY